MDDLVAMRMVQRIGDLRAVAQHVGSRHRPLRQAIVERLAFEILHDQKRAAVLFADVEEGTDVGMAQGGDRARFGLEPPRRSGRYANSARSRLTATVRCSRVSRAW